MKRLVMAAMLATAALTGLSGPALSMQLLRPAPVPAAQVPGSVGGAEILRVQSSDPRVVQLEEEIRSLNGRIEEMSFQLLQMQEQIRKFQEDNEFRFQELEKSGGVRKSEAPASPGASAPTDSVAEIITQPPAETGGSGTSERTLGTLDLDAGGRPIATSRNETAVDSSALPGVDAPSASQDTASAPIPDTSTPAPSSSGEVASLGSENDVYQAAYGHVLSGDYTVAENEFRQFISQYPQSPRIADANFWLGEAQYSQGNFNESAKTFLNAHQTYGSSPKAPEMLLKLGMSMAKLDNKDTACAIFREVGKRYPKASRAVTTRVSSEQKRLSC